MAGRAMSVATMAMVGARPDSRCCTIFVSPLIWAAMLATAAVAAMGALESSMLSELAGGGLVFALGRLK